MTNKNILFGSLVLLLSSQLSCISAGHAVHVVPAVHIGHGGAVVGGGNDNKTHARVSAGIPTDLFHQLDTYVKKINNLPLEAEGSDVEDNLDILFNQLLGNAINVVLKSFQQIISVNSKVVKGAAISLQEAVGHISKINHNLALKLGKIFVAVDNNLQHFVAKAEDPPIDVVGKYLSFAGGEGMTILLTVGTLAAKQLVLPAGKLIMNILETILDVVMGIVNVVRHSEKLINTAFPR